MSLTVCVDALIYWNGAAVANKNDVSIKQDVEVAEAKPFVASISVAFPTKTPTWKTWSATFNGYYDTTDNTVQNAIVAGTTAQLVVYPTRTDLTAYWYGNAFVKSSEQAINPTDYSTLNAEMEGTGVLTWLNV